MHEQALSPWTAAGKSSDAPDGHADAVRRVHGTPEVSRSGTHVLLHHFLPVLRVYHLDDGVFGEEGRRRQRRREGNDEREPVVQLHVVSRIAGDADRPRMVDETAESRPYTTAAVRVGNQAGAG